MPNDTNARMPRRLCHSIFVSEARRIFGNRLRILSKAIAASARASWKPRQKCTPVPKERCGFGWRVMSKL